MKVKDLYWAARNSTFFINLESEGRPLLCEPRLSDEGGVRIRLWLRDPAGTGTGGAIALLSRDEAAVLANAIDTRRNWVGEKADDALPRIGVSATVDSTMIRFMECRGEGHIALTVTEAGRLASWLHDMADGRWRDHNGYVLAAKWRKIGLTVEQVSVQDVRYGEAITKKYTEAQAAEIDKQKALNEQQVAKTEAETKKIKAQGEADANAVLNESLTDNVLKQHYIDALSNADQLVVVPDGADTLVQTK